MGGSALPEDHAELREHALRVLVREVQRLRAGRRHAQALYQALVLLEQLAAPVHLREVRANGLLRARRRHLQHPRGCGSRTALISVCCHIIKKTIGCSTYWAAGK